jgi:hypothetical protein
MPPWLVNVATAVSPVGGATSSIVDYILNYGVLGVAVVLFVLRIVVPRSAVDDAKAQARSDLLDENHRLIDEKRRAEEQRDEALRVARDQMVPLLSQFTAATGSLMPILQELVRDREGRRRDPGQGQRR